MPPKHNARWTLEKKARRRSAGFPIATIAYYGPTDQFASKVVVGIVDKEEEVIALERWFATEQDARLDDDICQKIVEFIEPYNVYRVAMVD